MNAYEAWIATLPEDQRLFVQAIMAHVMLILDDRFNELAADIQRVERRRATNATDFNLRLDQYEQNSWTMAKEAIEQFAARQLPSDQRDALIQLIYQLAVDVEALKAKQAGDGSK